MHNLLYFLVNIRHWFVFLLLEFVSLVLLFKYNGYQNNVYLTTANGFVGSVYSTISSVTSYLNLQTENNQLEAENQKLRQEVIAMRQQLADARLDSIVNHGLPAKYNVVSAQVVSSTLNKRNNLLTINRGEADGIRPEMGVVCSNGVVGVVYLTSAHYSIVIPLINESSKVSCRLRSTELFGTLEWRRGDVLHSFASGFPRHTKIKKGEIVETNGYSDIFPPGLPIGAVAKIGDSADGMSYKLTVQLFAQFQTLREVSVITNYAKPERRILEQQADSLSDK